MATVLILRSIDIAQRISPSCGEILFNARFEPRVAIFHKWEYPVAWLSFEAKLDTL